MDILKTKDNLEKLGYKVSLFDTKEEAARYLNREIDGKSVAFGGSVSLQEMGLFEMLSSHNDVIWHTMVEGQKEKHLIRREAVNTEVYVSSVNGLAETGEIINIDGIGNRVASMLYGHDKVYFVVGENKIAPDYDSALYRARNIAAPRNAQRLQTKTPCAEKGDRCYNCSSPQRICRGLAVLWENLIGADTEVVLVRETLGY